MSIEVEFVESCCPTLNKPSHKLTIAIIEVKLCPILLSLTKQPSHKLTIVIDDE